MANWTGTYNIAAGITGTSTGGNGANTFNNTGATWPTAGNTLVNFTLKITGGFGVGQERTVQSNTATQITVTSSWADIPDATSTYEIILRFKSGDHITGNIVPQTVILEIEDSATVYYDGAYSISSTTATTVIRMAKTWATLATFEANNRTVQGRANFGYLYLNVTAITPPQVQWIRFRDGGAHAILITSGNDTSGVHHLIADQCMGYFGAYITGTLPSNQKIYGLFSRGCGAHQYGFSNGTSNYNHVIERCWAEKSTSLIPTLPGNGALRSILRECVNLTQTTGGYTNITHASRSHEIHDCYYNLKEGSADAILLAATTAAHVGTLLLSRNTIGGNRTIYGPAVATPGYAHTKFNDWKVSVAGTYESHDITAANSFAGATSDNDFISGMEGASPDNVDTTEATTSTASPPQYKNLTSARTNAKAVRNRPLEVDNVVTGTPTHSSVVITFDSKNGVVAGQGSTTVNSDSAVGQPVLNVAATTGLEVGEVLEVGYGTARFETARVLSISAGVSVTFETNLVYTHTAAQADTVKKVLRHWVLPYIRYGTASSLLTMSTDLPKQEDWGYIWTGINQTLYGRTWEWKQHGHSVTLSGLTPGTTYYYQVFGITPTGEEITDGVVGSFTTTATADFSDPGVTNVRLGTTYQFNSPTPNRTGTCRVPDVANAKIGYSYDAGDSLTGTYDGSDRWTDPSETNVRLGTTYKANNLTLNKSGLLDLPTTADVKTGIQYDQLSKTGSYEGIERYTDLPLDRVYNGYTWRYNSLIDNRTGTGLSPADIQAAVWNADITSYTVTNSAAWYLKKAIQLIRNIMALVLG